MGDERWKTVAVGVEFAADPRAWLAARMRPGMPWLLAHADDGVIWGRRTDEGVLELAADVLAGRPGCEAVCAALRAATLQQARLFGPEGELLVWRMPGGFSARAIEDGASPGDDAVDEQHLLWGLPVRHLSAGGFTFLSEGQQGQQQAVPVAVPEGQRAALLVRHFVAAEPGGDANDEIAGTQRVVLSRLVEMRLAGAAGRGA